MAKDSFKKAKVTRFENATILGQDDLFTEFTAEEEQNLSGGRVLFRQPTQIAPPPPGPRVPWGSVFF